VLESHTACRINPTYQQRRADNLESALKNWIDLYKDWNKQEKVEQWRAKSQEKEAEF
jgi:hypothetical protein